VDYFLDHPVYSAVGAKCEITILSDADRLPTHTHTRARARAR